MHNSLTALLTQVRDGSISVADAALQLRELGLRLRENPDKKKAQENDASGK